MKQDWVKFLPLLVLNISVVLLFYDPELVGDEGRHLNYARHLVNGYFADPDNPVISNGPGYPLLLLPFVLAGLPEIIPTLLNAFLSYLAVIYFSKSLKLYLKPSQTTLLAYILGLYPPLFRWMSSLHAECFSLFLICGFIYHLIQATAIAKSWSKHGILAAIFLGLLIITKYIFFHVVLVFVILLLLSWLLFRSRISQQILIISSVALIMFLPYLMYTYNLTGKLLVVGTNGGEILYHRSSPYADEWGDWFGKNDIYRDKEFSSNKQRIYQDLSKLTENHKAFYDSVLKLDVLEQDAAFKAKAIENIKNHPKKYVLNTVANIGRLFFHNPFSYRYQSLDMYGYMIPNMFIISALVFSLYPAIKYYHRIPPTIWLLSFLIGLYLSAIALLGGRGRNFILALPVIILFVGYISTCLLSISVKIDENK